MKYIELTRGKQAIVDDEDFEWLSQWKWHIGSHGYPCRSTYYHKKIGVVLMHRAILEPQAGLLVDHINLNKLDNRRSNLRIVTQTQNSYNKPVRIDCKSRYKGVRKRYSRPKAAHQWNARIKSEGREINLGYYATPEDAAKAYNIAARRLFGDFAYLNEA